MMMRLLFDDEGEIARADWWLGTILLICLHALASALAVRLASPLVASGIKTFLAIAVLVPFYSVNAKRFCATGRAPELALWGAVLPAFITLTALSGRWALLDLTLGLATLTVILWYIIDLGMIDHQPTVDRSRLPN
jgi:uncharacterized membrane protein YhaH (DUF805 family)